MHLVQPLQVRLCRACKVGAAGAQGSEQPLDSAEGLRSPLQAAAAVQPAASAGRAE